MIDVPSTESVVAVLEANRAGSMAAAAVQLGVTHGAVSRRVQAVEHWLGAPVFERVGRGVRLTPQGALFVRRAERSLSAIEAFRFARLNPSEALAKTATPSAPAARAA